MVLTSFWPKKSYSYSGKYSEEDENTKMGFMAMQKQLVL